MPSRIDSKLSTKRVRLCACGCARVLPEGHRKYYSQACRHKVGVALTSKRTSEQGRIDALIGLDALKQQGRFVEARAYALTHGLPASLVPGVDA